MSRTPRIILSTLSVLALAAAIAAAPAAAKPRARAAHDVIDSSASCTAASIRTAHFAPGATVQLVVQDATSLITSGFTQVGPDGIATIEFATLSNSEIAVVVSAFWTERGKPYQYVSPALAIPQPCTPPVVPPGPTPPPAPPVPPVPPACVPVKVHFTVRGHTVTASKKVRYSVDGHRFGKPRRSATARYGLVARFGCGQQRHWTFTTPPGLG